MHSPLSLLFTLSSISNYAAAFTTTLGSTKSVTSPPSSFSTHCAIQQNQPRRRFHLFSTTDSTNLEEEIKSMRVGAIKQELESYGISTRTFLEKAELVDALIAARKEGKTPISTAAKTSSSSSTSTSTSSSYTTTSSAAESSPGSATNPEQRLKLIKEEQDKCKEMKVQELKAELDSLGVSTTSFFEKSEFVRALAEARVDGVKKSKKKKRRAASDDDGDDVEEVTAKVEVITNDSVGPKTKKSRDNTASAGGNPFGGGGGSPFGGMPFGAGGMGGMDMNNIADMLKGMGGMGGAAGGNPFAGAAGGGAGMADAMKAAQQAMNNPKVKKVIEKAQKNPKVQVRNDILL